MKNVIQRNKEFKGFGKYYDLKKTLFFLLFLAFSALLFNFNLVFSINQVNKELINLNQEGIKDVGLLKKLNKFMKVQKNSILLNSPADYYINVIICYDKKQKGFISKIKEKSKTYYCLPKKLTYIQLLSLLNQDVIVFQDKKLNLTMYNAINFTHGSFYLNFLNKISENIDSDSENETLAIIIPYLNWSYKPKFNTTIVVIDTGVDLNNPWIKNQYEKGKLLAYGVEYNYTTGECQLTSNYSDDEGHGTFVISEIISLNPNATIISLKPKDLTLTNVACAIKLANKTFNADIVSMSLGYFPYFFDGYNDLLWNTIDDVNNSNNNIMFSIAMGNNGNNNNHYRCETPCSNIIIDNKNLGNYLVLFLKEYNGVKYNVDFYSNNNLVGYIHYNTSTGTYNVYSNESYFDFDVDNDDNNDIYYLESDKTKENDLIIYLNLNETNNVNNLTFTIKGINSNTTIDSYAFYDFLSGTFPYNAKFSNYDRFSTITSPATYPSAFSIGSVNINNKIYYFDNNSKNYYYLTIYNGETENVSIFSSRGVPAVYYNGLLSFELKKPELTAPGSVLFGANANNYYYIIFNKTFNTGDNPLFTLFYNNGFKSFTTYMQGTSMATPFFSGTLSILKSFFKYENRGFFRKLINYLTFETSYTQNLSVYDKGSGIIDLKKVFDILPKANLTSYKIDYTNRKIYLNVSLNNSLGVNYNLSFFKVIFHDNSGNKSFIFNVRTGINQLVLNLDDLNLTANKYYNITLSGEIVNDDNYSIYIEGANISLINASYNLNLNFKNWSIESNNLNLTLNLNYSLNNLGLINCSIINNNSEVFNFTLDYGLNKITFPINKLPFTFKIYCDYNINNYLNYTFDLKDLILENQINTSSTLFNLTFYKNVTLNDSLGHYYSLVFSVNFDNKTLNNINNNQTLQVNLANYSFFDYKVINKTINITIDSQLLDSFNLLVLSNYSLLNYSLDYFENNETDNEIRPIIIVKRGTISNPYCKLSIYLNDTEAFSANLYNCSLFNIKKYNESGILINEFELDNPYYFIKTNKTTYNVTINLTCPLNLKNNDDLTRTYNFSEVNNIYNFNLAINQSSFFTNLSILIDSSKESVSSSIFVYNLSNNELIFNKTFNFNSTIYKEVINGSYLFNLYKKIGIKNFYSYNYSSLLNNNPLINNYYYKVIGIVNWNYSQDGIRFISKKKESVKQIKRPEIYLKAFSNNDNKSKFNKNTTFIVYLTNNESLPLDFVINSTKSFVGELENQVFIANNSSSVIYSFNGSSINSEGNFTLNFYIENNSFPLVIFNDSFVYDCIYPNISNISLDAHYFNNSYYTNNSVWVNGTITDNHFCGNSCFHSYINNETAVIFSIENKTDYYSFSFFVNKSVLEFGKNNITILAEDTFGNNKTYSFALYYDNETPRIIVKPESTEFFNYMILNLTENDSYPYFTTIKNNLTGQIFNKSFLFSKNRIYLIPCSSGNNELIISSYDLALNKNETNKDYNCYINYDNFNISVNFQFDLLGSSNKSVKVIVNRTLSYLTKDNYKLMIYNYSFNFTTNLNYFAIGPEEENNSYYNLLIIKNNNIIFNLSELSNKDDFLTTINNKTIPLIILNNISKDDKIRVYSIYKLLVFDGYLKGLNNIFAKKIIAKLIVNNVTSVSITNENLSQTINIDNPSNNSIIEIPCVNGKNKIILTLKNNNQQINKVYYAYCNNSIIKGDSNLVDSVVINSTGTLIINDSYVSDYSNTTFIKKQILINFTIPPELLILKIYIGDYNLNKVLLNNSGTIKDITNNATYENGYVIVKLDLKNDPVLIIEGSKSSENDKNTESSTTSSTSSTTYYSSSGGGGGGGTYYYSSYSLANNNIDIINITDDQIFIRKELTDDYYLKLNVTWPEIDKLIVYATGKLIEINITRKKDINSLGKGIKIIINKLINASLEFKFKDNYNVFVKEGGIFKLTSNNLTVTNKTVIFVVNRDKKVQILSNNETRAKEPLKNNKTENIIKSFNEPQNESNITSKQEKGKPLWLKIIIYLGIGIIIFLIIDFINFLIKRVKGKI
ncbi:MAG: S8 family serine peptidase [Nanoarchaeota archaeon]